MSLLRRNLPSLLCLIAMAAFSVYLYDALPDQLPRQFNLKGDVISTMPRQIGVMVMPLVFLAVMVVVNVMVRISPHKFAMPNSQRAMDIILFGVGLLMLCSHIAILRGEGNMQYFSIGMAAFLIITGNVFGKTERNFFIGLRLPWTLASTANWKATHRLAGKLMVVSGCALLVFSILLPDVRITIFFILAPLLIALLYSPYYYFKFEKNGA